MSWYYSEGSEQRGPISRETLESMAHQGRLSPDQLVWTEGFGSEWKRADSVEGLFNSTPAPDGSEPGPVSASETSAPATPSDPSAVQPQQVPVYTASSDGQWDGFAPNRELTRRARSALSGNWGLGIGVFLIHLLMTQAISNLVPVIGPFIVIFITAPLTLGFAIVFLNVARDNQPEVGQLFAGFSTYWPSLGVYVLTTIFVLLWMLLLIIPGIIASIAYSQCYYLLADHPNLKPMDVIESSKVLMKGHKWQYFCLGFRFLGWILLSVLTLGIGLLWVAPYMQSAYAEFYLELRKHQKKAEA